MDKIIIKNLIARGIIGINDWEREKKQEIRINIVVHTDTKQAGLEDDLNLSVNYRTLSKKVQLHAETVGRLTVEALAEDIAKLCLEENGVEKIQVTVEKPGAVRFAESVGVEIKRSKDDYQS